jgi:hypothetical protein
MKLTVLDGLEETGSMLDDGSDEGEACILTI